MDTARRTLLKSITWQLLGLITMTALSYPQTGTLQSAFALAASASGMGFACFFIHERIWSRINWGRQAVVHSQPAEPKPQIYDPAIEIAPPAPVSASAPPALPGSSKPPMSQGRME